MSHSESTSTEIFIGIDWADQEHAVCLMTADGQLEHTTIKHSPEAITAWIDQLLERFPGCDLLVAVEQNRGALANALLASGSVRLYPINPAPLLIHYSAPSSARRFFPVDASQTRTTPNCC